MADFLIILSNEAPAPILCTMSAGPPFRASAFPLLRLNHCRSFSKFVIHISFAQRIPDRWPSHIQRRQFWNISSKGSLFNQTL